MPVQLNRKQYENLFESFDYTKEATVDAGKAEEREDKEDADTSHGGGVRQRILETRGNNGPPSDLQNGSHFYF